MIEKTAELGDLEAAEGLFQKMWWNGLAPTPENFMSVIAACSRARRADAAEQWLQRMADYGVAPDTMAFSCAIDVCFRAGDTQRGLGLFQKMCAAGVPPNIVTYSSLAKLFARTGDFVMVERLKVQLDKDGLPMYDHFLCALLDAYANAVPREVERAERAFVAAVPESVEPTERVLGALARAVGDSRAKELLRELDD